MTNRFLMSVAGAALLASGVAANAQSPGSSGGPATSPSIEKSAPATKGSGAAPMQRSEPATSGESRAPAADRRADDQMQKGMSDHDGDRSNMKAEDRNERDTNRNADNDRGRDMKRDADKDGTRNQDSKRNADNDRDRKSTTTGQAGAHAKLSSEQRTKITTVIRKENIRPETHVNFSISVGTRVPREVHFHRLPTEIVTIYPDWRGYEFFRVRDQIVVVDPDTLEIVAVLDV
jgi:hypothetical protein